MVLQENKILVPVLGSILYKKNQNLNFGSKNQTLFQSGFG
jgi:hypothetical protein